MSEYVPMSPSGSIEWRSYPAPSGTLMLPAAETANDDIIAAALLTAEKGPKLGAGAAGGKVYVPSTEYCEAIPYTAIKEFHGAKSSDLNTCNTLGRLSTLRAHVMLNTGLKIIDQSGHDWQIAGADIRGAYLAGDNSSTPSRWLMRRAMPVSYLAMLISGVHVAKPGQESPMRNRLANKLAAPFPGYEERVALYDHAMYAANGYQPTVEGRVSYDDQHRSNVLIERLPRRQDGAVIQQGLATKIDIMDLQGFDF